MLQGLEIMPAFTFMKLQGDSSRIELPLLLVAKLLGQWRQEFFDNGWLDSYERPEITIKRGKIFKKSKTF